MSKESPLGNDLAMMISKAIENSGLKEAAIAKKMGVSRQVINRICDRKTFDIDFLQDLKNASGLDFTNYVFNPKTKKHEPIAEISEVAEPQSQYGKETLEMSFTVVVKAQEDSLRKLSEMILFFKKEAINRGFKVA